MVPIVEPEVFMDGDHSADDCYDKTSEVIKKCFEELILHNVDLIWNNFKAKHDPCRK